MTSPRPPWLRLPRAASLTLACAAALAACAVAQPTPTTAPPSPSTPATASPTPTPDPSPSPTPDPTPRFTNEPDPELAGLIPGEVAGVPVVVAPLDEFGLTPGDIGATYGEIGNRFASLALAYTEGPRATLYAVRVDGEPVETEDLEPHLATAARYVGIAGLDPEPWELTVVAGNQTWTRPEDNATAAGTHLYTWSSGEFVFLLIGVDDALNQALVAALPGQPAPTPRPAPSSPGSGAPSVAPTASESAAAP